MDDSARAKVRPAPRPTSSGQSKPWRVAAGPPLAYLLIAGSGLFARREGREGRAHTLEPFDAWLRSAGPLFPFPMLMLRLALGSRQRSADVAIKAVAFAVSAAAIRLAIYLLLRALGKHVVSDHLLLAASVLAALQVDLGAASRLVKGGFAQAHRALSGCTTLLGLCLALDANATCSIFHGPVESILGLAGGALIFQLPACLLAFRLASGCP